MRIDPYPDALIRQGFYKNEPRETAHPVLEDAMMYMLVVGMEIMEGLVIVQDAVDRTALETSERKVEVDGALVRLRHQLGQWDDRVTIMEDWQREATEHLRDIGDLQGLIWGRLTEAELRVCQLQALVLTNRREVELLGDVMGRQMAVIEAQRRLISLGVSAGVLGG